MPNYHRQWIAGGSYFFTVVTHQRRRWLCHPAAREALREAVKITRQNWPFTIDAWVLLPDHMHCIWTLPDSDADYARRWGQIKQRVSMKCAELYRESDLSASRLRRREQGLWQRRYWEHRIRDEHDFQQHCDYIHYNPVKHSLCLYPMQWPYSTLRRLIKSGLYPPNWGMTAVPAIDEKIGHE